MSLLFQSHLHLAQISSSLGAKCSTLFPSKRLTLGPVYCSGGSTYSIFFSLKTWQKRMVNLNQHRTGGLSNKLKDSKITWIIQNCDLTYLQLPVVHKEYWLVLLLTSKFSVTICKQVVLLRLRQLDWWGGPFVPAALECYLKCNSDTSPGLLQCFSQQWASQARPSSSWTPAYFH